MAEIRSQPLAALGPLAVSLKREAGEYRGAIMRLAKTAEPARLN